MTPTIHLASDHNGYTTGYRGRCPCGWHGPVRDRPSQVLIDIHDHHCPPESP